MLQKQNLIYWLRWVLVLPAALGGYIGIQIFVADVTSYELWPGAGLIINIFCQLINSGLGPFCLVFAGAKTAPKYHFIVAIVLTTMHAIINVSLVTVAAVTKRHSDPLQWIILACIIGIITEIFVCIKFYKEENEPTSVKIS